MEDMRIGRNMYKIADFLEWQRQGTLELSPSFQRRPVWPPAAKSYLVDTIVRGLPVPIIFLREHTDLDDLRAKRVVVDGQQRLRTLLSFIDPSCIKDFHKERDVFTISLTHNREIAHKSFEQLPKAIRQRILDYEFSVHTLPSGTDDKQVLQIFARMNATGVRLNAQELRNAEYFGEFKASMYTLAYEQIDRWREWHIYGEQDIARMEEVEGTSDLVLYVMDGMHPKNQKLLDGTYSKYDAEFPQKEEVQGRFRKTMDAIEDILGSDLHKLAFSRKTLFDTLFAFVYDRLYGLDSPLGETRQRKLPPDLGESLRRVSRRIMKRDVPDDVAVALRGGTSHEKSRTARLDFVRQVCEVA